MTKVKMKTRMHKIKQVKIFNNLLYSKIIELFIHKKRMKWEVNKDIYQRVHIKNSLKSNIFKMSNIKDIKKFKILLNKKLINSKVKMRMITKFKRIIIKFNSSKQIY